MKADEILVLAKGELDGVCIADWFDNFIDDFSSQADAVLALQKRERWTIDYINRFTEQTLVLIDNFRLDTFNIDNLDG